MADWWRSLRALGECIENEPMSRHATLGVGGQARWFFRPRSCHALVEAMAVIPEDIPVLPLGRGSNLLIPDAGFDGLVADVGELQAVDVEETALSAECGARMSRVARKCAESGLGGLEFMATVPGNVGGGVAMNAGAFGQQVSDVLRAVDVVLRSGEVSRIAASDLDMAYRRTLLPQGAVVLRAFFELQQDDADAIRARMREMRARRGASQPLDMPNCGSVFKNPPNDHAARLIEAAGLKGLRIGGACISAKHANFIVNEGDATSGDVLELIRRARRRVHEKFGVRLEPEVRIIGAAL